MSTPIEIRAVVRCGLEDCTHAINVPVGERRRSERRPFTEGYVDARGWTVKTRPFDITFAVFGDPQATPSDWRCPEHSKAATA